MMGKAAGDTCRSTKNWQSSLAICQMLPVGGHKHLARGKGWPLGPYGGWTKVISSRKPKLNLILKKKKNLFYEQEVFFYLKRAYFLLIRKKNLD
jgi:hypothetical protein